MLPSKIALDSLLQIEIVSNGAGLVVQAADGIEAGTFGGIFGGFAKGGIDGIGLAIDACRDDFALRINGNGNNYTTFVLHIIDGTRQATGTQRASVKIE